MSRRHLSIAVLVTCGMLGTGCSTDTDGAQTAGATSSVAPSSAVVQDVSDGGNEPAFAATTDPDVGEGDPAGGAGLTVSEVRVARQDGFDRVVFELGGQGTPGWDVRYVDAAVSQGKGDTLDVPGSAVLQVTLTGMGYPYDTGVTEWAGPDPLTAPGTTDVAGVVYDATFEGTTAAFVGTNARTPFRVFALTGPTRVVIDVADPS